jgi:hypothetical protein
MPSAMQFWPGIGGNYVNPARDAHEKTIAQNETEEVRLVAHEAELRVLGEKLAAEHGLKFIGVTRRHPYGTSVPRDARLKWMVGPESIFELGFEVARAGVSGWRVRKELSPGIVLSGKCSSGWNVWLEEKDLDKVGSIFKSKVSLAD